MSKDYLRSSINCLIKKKDELQMFIESNKAKLRDMDETVKNIKEFILAWEVELKNIKNTIKFLGEEETK